MTILLFILFQTGHSQNDFHSRLNNAALSLTKQEVSYDPGYFSIPYPGGDVPADKGQVTEDCLFRYKIIGHYRYGN